MSKTFHLNLMQGLIPDWRTKIPHATLCGKNNTKQGRKKKKNHLTSGVKENCVYLFGVIVLEERGSGEGGFSGSLLGS